MPKTIGQATIPRQRRVSRRPDLDRIDDAGPVYCTRDQDFVWMSSLIDAVQATGKDVGGLLMKIIRPVAKK